MTWYENLDPVEELVECGGALHVVRWERGRLELEDHDVDAEHTAAALGGSAPECMHLLAAWRATQRSGGLSFLSSWARMARMPAGPWRRRLYRTGPGRGGAAVMSLTPEEIALSLPGALRERLALGIVAAMEGRALSSDEIRAVEAVLSARAAPAVERAAQHAGQTYRGLTCVEVRLAGPSQAPHVDGWASSRSLVAVARLAPGWMTRVWARGIGIVDGCFVLDAQEAGSDHLEATVATWVTSANACYTPQLGRATLSPGPAGWTTLVGPDR